jgi:uncharacterized protein YqeY
MSLTETIQKDMLTAAKEGRSVQADILKVVLSSLKNEKIAKPGGTALTEEEEMKAVFSESKKIKDSIEQFEKAGREDLAKREREQLAVVERYLPEQAGEDDIRKVVKEVIEETGASNLGQMGMVMGVSMKKLQGKADGKIVSEVVKDMLS